MGADVKTSGRSADPGSQCREIEVSPPITLGQFVKLADLAASGGEAKETIAAGAVSVNGEVEFRRGRKLTPGDRVSLGFVEVVVKQAGAPRVSPESPPAGSPGPHPGRE